MTHIIAACGDLHCGSTVGWCPPDGLELDDGGMYEPSEAQLWLWQCWEQAWAKAKEIIGRDEWSLVLNGDLIDGDHHRSSQIASVLTGIHVRCAMESLQVPLDLKPSSIHICRGTPSHTGRSGEVEEGISRTLKNQLYPVVKDPDTGNFSSYRRRIDVEKVRFSVAHHGRMGMRAHTRGSYSRLFAFDIWAETALDLIRDLRNATDHKEVFERKRPPDVAIRSHRHQFQDSGYDHRGITRVVSMPAYQLATEFVHKITAAESLADIGIVLFICNKGEVEVRPILFTPRRETVVRA